MDQLVRVLKLVLGPVHVYEHPDAPLAFVGVLGWGVLYFMGCVLGLEASGVGTWVFPQLFAVRHVPVGWLMAGGCLVPPVSSTTVHEVSPDDGVPVLELGDDTFSLPPPFCL